MILASDAGAIFSLLLWLLVYAAAIGIVVLVVILILRQLRS